MSGTSLLSIEAILLATKASSIFCRATAESLGVVEEVPNRRVGIGDSRDHANVVPAERRNAVALRIR
jgi:hypothetical protein